MTAQLEGIESAQPTTPVPTAMIARWFPAHVTLPDGHSMATALTYATDVGLYVFAARPADDAELSDAWFSPINWTLTQAKPPQPRVAFEVYTADGPVKITPMAGCGCHLRALKNWHPSWAARSVPWGGA